MRGERIVWTPEEDEYLRRAVQIYGDKTEKWAKIAACVPGRTNKNCRKRWFHSLDPRLKKGGWTEEEDHLLRIGVQKFRGQWSKIAERIQGRTDDQCAKRWRESLDPEIDRAAWTPDEDILLLQKYEEHGTQWQKIALSFLGRPGLHCRNRWRKIQRSMNHMERANKRRRHRLVIREAHSGTPSSVIISGPDHQTTHSFSEDALLQDAFLNDNYGLLEDSNDPPNDGEDDPSPEEERPYGCAVPDCKFESSSPSLLYYHFKASHHGTTILKPFRCTVPGCEDRKRYKNINGLQYHVTHAKNTPGHAGNHGRPSTTSPPMEKMEDVVVSSLPKSLGSSVPSAPKPVSSPIPSFPTPGEIQSVFSPLVPQPLIIHQAFNIPHTPESLEDSFMPSPNMAMDIATPQACSRLQQQQHQQQQHQQQQCPELGCGQAFNTLCELTTHMATSHGHQSIILESNDPTFGPDSIVIPESNFDDVDLDLGFFSTSCESTSSTSMGAATNLLLMDDTQQLQARLDELTVDHGAALNLDFHTSNSTQEDLDILSMNELLFANYITNSLNNLSPYNNQNRVHFGTHINVSANDSLTLPATPFTSANVSPQLKAINILADNNNNNNNNNNHNTAVSPADLAAPTTTTSTSHPRSESGSGTGTTTAVVKRFPCSVADCPKSYASNSAMRAHLRHDHPDAYAKAGKSTNKACPNNLTNITTTRSSPSPPPRAVALAPIAPAPHQKLILKKPEEPSGKPFKCLVSGCGKEYSNISGLKTHLLQTHGSTPKRNATVTTGIAPASTTTTAATTTTTSTTQRGWYVENMDLPSISSSSSSSGSSVS
ncbi:hypothetical protein BGZ65_004118 [Modicella reniformis]|uniref:Uncharacterized protein n=1 Tax=Modicella reniformis TaxID=1440133 RepID=A0A9P6J6Y7_9FUNG|nr:hypothetical protein BGZ65_004118 [Modicella reniformis]